MHTSRFKEALSYYASGVVILTTVADDGTRKGFTASSFASVSASPPLVLVCLGKSAECYASFVSADHFAINILRPHHLHLAELFAKRGAAKFESDCFSTGVHGLPILKSAAATLICKRFAAHPGGDHSILVGEVVDSTIGARGQTMVHYLRHFWNVGNDEIGFPVGAR